MVAERERVQQEQRQAAEQALQLDRVGAEVLVTTVPTNMRYCTFCTTLRAPAFFRAVRPNGQPYDICDPCVVRD